MRLYLFVLVLILCINCVFLQSCKLSNPYPDIDVSLGFPRIENRVKTIGNLKISVLFVDFIDEPAKQTAGELFSIISPTTENFFNTSSYGLLKVVFKPHLKWIRMKKPSIEYGMSKYITFKAQREFIQEAVDLASSDFDFSNTDEVLVMVNPDCENISYGPTLAFDHDNETGIFINGKLVYENAISSGYDLNVWDKYWLAHELSHSLGLPDLYAYENREKGIEQFKFTGDWGIMGNIGGLAKEHFGWEKWLLGWINDTQIECFSSKGSFDVHLSPVEIAETKHVNKLVVVPLSNFTAFVLESRRSIDFDQLNKPGVLPYLVDTSVNAGEGYIKILPLKEKDYSKQNFTLSAGQFLKYGNITVIFKQSTEQFDYLNIIIE